MKKFLLLFITSLILSTVTFASFPVAEQTIIDSCDNIILKSGDEISAKIIEITPDLIKYKKCGKLDGPLISIYKNEVLMLRYNDGSKDLFYTEVTDSVKDNEKSEVPMSGIFSLTFSLISLLIPLPLFLSLFFAGVGLLSGFGSFNEKYWGVGLAGMIIGTIDLIILYSLLL